MVISAQVTAIIIVFTPQSIILIIIFLFLLSCGDPQGLGIGPVPWT